MHTYIVQYMDGLFQCNGGELVLHFEVVPESVVNTWEETFYFRLQRVT